MLRFFNKRIHNRKGFTLIELIVVIAILGIIALIAIPRFRNIQFSARIDSDSSSARQIVNAARIQETDTGTALADIGDLTDVYMAAPAAPQSGGAFALTGGGDANYEVSWTATAALAGPFAGDYTVDEEGVVTTP